MVELVLETDLAPEQREYLSLAKSSAEGLLGLLNEILDFSRIESGALDLDPIPFHLRDSLREMLQSQALRARTQGLDLSYDIDPTVPDALVGDPGRLRQILAHLIGNAIQFTPEGQVAVECELAGELTQEPRSASDGLGGAWVALRFTVRDTGVGIPEEKQALIFEAFTHASEPGGGGRGGAGLGLAICRQLVEKMGGEIGVTSAPGKGSAFSFSVCLRRQEDLEDPATLGEPIVLRDLPVLVVEADVVHRRILRETLSQWGMQPIVVSGGEAALEALRARQAATARDGSAPIALVILDAAMPTSDREGFGFELARALRQEAEVPILMLSSEARRGDGARCRAEGIAGYFTKPIRPRDLLEAIATILGRTKQPGVSPPLVTRHALREKRQRLALPRATGE
jgi:CheY-like chemotaxis protein